MIVFWQNILNMNQCLSLCLAEDQIWMRHRQRVRDGKHHNWKTVFSVGLGYSAFSFLNSLGININITIKPMEKRERGHCKSLHTSYLHANHTLAILD